MCYPLYKIGCPINRMSGHTYTYTFSVEPKTSTVLYINVYMIVCTDIQGTVQYRWEVISAKPAENMKEVVMNVSQCSSK